MAGASFPTIVEWTRSSTVIFIDNIKLHPCLWRVTIKEYKDRDARHAALEKILRVMAHTVENLTIDDLKKKINTLRSQFSREYRLVENSKKSDSDINFYMPKLWCYNRLTFLKEHDIHLATTTSDVSGNKVNRKSSFCLFIPLTLYTIVDEINFFCLCILLLIYQEYVMSCHL